MQANHPDLVIAESGDASITQAVDSSLNFRQAETTSIPITLILLAAVFGSLVAAGIPVLLPVSALTAALGVLTLASSLVPVTGATSEVVVVIGIPPRAAAGRPPRSPHRVISATVRPAR